MAEGVLRTMCARIHKEWNAIERPFKGSNNGEEVNNLEVCQLNQDDYEALDAN